MHRRRRAEGGDESFAGLARPPRRRAQDEVRRARGGEALADPAGGGAAAPGERAVAVGEAVIDP